MTLFDAEPVKEIPPPPRPDLYIVMAYREHWTIPSALRGPWLTTEAAEKEAGLLHASWTHRTIVKIPGRGR